MKIQTVFLLILLVVSFPCITSAQVNSGSNGSDGAFNPTQNVTIDMNLRPDGIYHYTSVNIPSGVTVTFTPNANNTPVVWLVQGDCVISGIIDISANLDSANPRNIVQIGGPGGFMGGNGGSAATIGHGPGGGGIGSSNGRTFGGNASFATVGQTYTNQVNGIEGSQGASGSIYGTSFIVPLIGGSGGGGNGLNYGGGGGGAMMIAVSGKLTLNNTIRANGSASWAAIIGEPLPIGGGGAGSGGAVRLVASRIEGSGSVSAVGGSLIGAYFNLYTVTSAGSGRIRLDTIDNAFNGSVSGSFTQGFQPIILPAAGQGSQLAIQSIGGIAVGSNPNGVLANPDLVIPPQQQNPMNVVVGCSNLPLNTLITVVVRPANGEEIVATGRNTNGSVASSTVSIPVTMPRGGGIVYAKCVSGVNGVSATGSDSKVKNIAQTGWTADGETFAQMEIVAGMDGRQQVAYITESGKRYALPTE